MSIVYDEDGDEIYMPTAIINPQPLSTQPTLKLNESISPEDISDLFHGVNGLINEEPTIYGLTQSTFDSFHQSTAQVKFDANASLSYKGQARMLDVGEKACTGVRSMAMMINSTCESKIYTDETHQASMLIMLLIAEYENLNKELDDHVVRKHLDEQDAVKIQERMNMLKKQIDQARQLSKK